jgi:bacterioferritin
MAEPKFTADQTEISRDRLAELLNEDLAREYQAIIAYVVYSQVLTGAAYMDIAAQLEIHATQELDHALTLSRQIDYLGKMPVATPKPVLTSTNPQDMLRYDLDNETIRNYRNRVRQCEALGEYAMTEQIRQILVEEQDHQIDLATALGIEVPDVSGGPKDAAWASVARAARRVGTPFIGGSDRRFRRAGAAPLFLPRRDPMREFREIGDLLRWAVCPSLERLAVLGWDSDDPPIEDVGLSGVECLAPDKIAEAGARQRGRRLQKGALFLIDAHAQHQGDHGHVLLSPAASRTVIQTGSKITLRVSRRQRVYCDSAPGRKPGDEANARTRHPVRRATGCIARDLHGLRDLQAE